MANQKTTQALIAWKIAGSRRFCRLALAAVLLTAFCATRILADEDQIEFLSGAKVAGKVVKIDKDAKTIEFQAKIGGRTIDHVYPYSKVHTVLYDDKKYVINEKADNPEKPAADDKKAGAEEPSRPHRTKAEVDALIQQAGAKPPAWFRDTPLEIPPDVDLTFTPPKPGTKATKQFVQQYLWNTVNPNPSHWKSAVRLMDHALTLNKDDPKALNQTMRALANMYFIYFQDYARAAYLWQKLGVKKGEYDALGLAECYWRLGSQETALEYLVDPDHPVADERIMPQMIRLWGEMGEVDKALKLADTYGKSLGKGNAGIANMFAAAACRSAGRIDEAIKRYQMVLDEPSDPKRGNGWKPKAQVNLDALKLAEKADVAKVANGVYHAVAQGYVGDVEVELTVKGGRISAVRVTNHHEKQFYSSLTDVPNQIIAKQGVKGVDCTSRATITSEAIINASAKALASGSK